MPPALTIDETDAINVRDVTITSSPFFIPKTSSAKSIATVPFDRDIEYLESIRQKRKKTRSRKTTFN